MDFDSIATLVMIAALCLQGYIQLALNIHIYLKQQRLECIEKTRFPELPV